MIKKFFIYNLLIIINTSVFANGTDTLLIKKLKSFDKKWISKEWSLTDIDTVMLRSNIIGLQVKWKYNDSLNFKRIRTDYLRLDYSFYDAVEETIKDTTVFSKLYFNKKGLLDCEELYFYVNNRILEYRKFIFTCKENKCTIIDYNNTINYSAKRQKLVSLKNEVFFLVGNMKNCGCKITHYKGSVNNISDWK